MLGALKLTVRRSIVAIHGLDGQREKAWTADNEKMWLRDFLPLDIPNARILTYGYNADTHSSELVSAENISQHADIFLRALERERKHAKRVCTNNLIVTPPDSASATDHLHRT